MFPSLLGKYPGDALWALMVFLIWGLAFPKHATLRVALYALATSYLVEFSQLYQAPWIHRIRETLVGHLVIGSGFAWADMIAYTVGICIGAFFELAVLSRAGIRLLA
jgi:hypothetical protein